MEKVTLYGLNKDGSLKQWSIWCEGAEYVVEHGKVGGKMQTKRNLCEAKNVGRANATTPEQQAEAEALAKIQKQQDKGYRLDQADLGDLPFKPMLAHDYTKGKNSEKVRFPCLATPKLDGVRCTAYWKGDQVFLESRGGKEYPAPVHIQYQLSLVMGRTDRIDGELYVHGEMLQDITGAAKKWRELTDRLEFHVFDVVREGGYTDRLAWLENWFSSMPDDCSHIKLVPVMPCTDADHLKELHDQFVLDGFEGAMIRNQFGEYEQRRSYDLQKYKEFMDAEYLIIGIRKDRNDNAVFVLEHPNGEFTTTYGSYDERKHQLAHPEEYIGKYLTVQFQNVYKDTMMPQFPTGKGVRAGKMIDGEFHPEA